MRLSFLPEDVKTALSNLNCNYLTEIRLRRGQPVMAEYKGKYVKLNRFGIAEDDRNLIIVSNITPIINAAVGGSMYNYTEQMKSGFITVEHGVRIGLAGEYVTQGGSVQAIKNITSLNIRIPHDIDNCSQYLAETLFLNGLHSTLLYSKPGFGKTTMLRDLAKKLGASAKCNVLIFDERNEISAMDGNGNGYDLGENVDVIRCKKKKSAITGAIRAMKPQLIITDELYGDEDISAMQYAVDCGIYVIASTHVCNKDILKTMPFEYFAELTGIGENPLIYDKNFNIVGSGGADNVDRNIFIGK